MEAFRTNSYVEIYDKVQAQLATTGGNKEVVGGGSSSSSSHLITRHESFSGCLLQLCQETMAELPQQASNAHPLLAEYFDVSLEACMICESLLKIVLQTQTNYKNIKKAVKKIEKFPRNAVWSEDEVNSLYSEIASFSLLGNPLSGITQLRFNEVQDGHFGLLNRLTSKRMKTEKRMKKLMVFKKVLGSTFVVAYTAFAVTFVILTIHFTVAACATAVPGLIAYSSGMFKKLKETKRGMQTSSLARLYMQLDAATKGMYILINDLRTVSRLMGRLNDEMEHDKNIADMCARKHNDDMLKQVVRGFAIHEGWFLEQLKELEQYIYLCFLNIIRARRMVVQEITGCHETVSQNP